MNKCMNGCTDNDSSEDLRPVTPAGSRLARSVTVPTQVGAPLVGPPRTADTQVTQMTQSTQVSQASQASQITQNSVKASKERGNLREYRRDLEALTDKLREARTHSQATKDLSDRVSLSDTKRLSLLLDMCESAGEANGHPFDTDEFQSVLDGVSTAAQSRSGVGKLGTDFAVFYKSPLKRNKVSIASSTAASASSKSAAPSHI